MFFHAHPKDARPVNDHTALMSCNQSMIYNFETYGMPNHLNFAVPTSQVS